MRGLRAMGVERIFASPGSDWAPVWEALAAPHADRDFPRYVSSRHEETAVAMAMGYAKATGKLPAVFLQTTVGSLHATMIVRAALHERIPMVVLAGESIGFAEPPGPKVGRQWLRLLDRHRRSRPADGAVREVELRPEPERAPAAYGAAPASSRWRRRGDRCSCRSRPST